MHRKVPAGEERVLGKEHPDILSSMNKLAGVLSDQGKYGEAEEMFRQALAVMERVLGKEHPSTLTNTNNLTGVLSDQGKYEEAAEVVLREVSDRELAGSI